MPLDFTWMDALSGQGTDTASQGQPNKIDAPQLERQAKGVLEERQKISAAYKEYQDNIKLAGQDVTAIRKGISAGADIYDLFLKAMDAIGRMTGDRSLYDQTRAQILTVYGIGGREETPLRMELEEITRRIDKLTAARSSADPARLGSIDHAIREHQRRAEEIRAELSGIE